MLERFYPNEYLDSVYDIDFEMYYKQGIRGIISDIDNTLVPHGAPATEEIVALFDKIHKLGIDTCLISVSYTHLDVYKRKSIYNNSI